MPGKRILLVEDDSDIALMMNAMLRPAGYEVVLAPDAVVALTVARSQHPDLILLDMQMPGGSGLDVLQRLQSNLATALTPVLIVTASQLLTEEEAKAAGAVGLLQKPFDREELLDRVKEIVGEP